MLNSVIWWQYEWYRTRESSHRRARFQRHTVSEWIRARVPDVRRFDAAVKACLRRLPPQR